MTTKIKDINFFKLIFIPLPSQLIDFDFELRIIPGS